MLADDRRVEIGDSRPAMKTSLYKDRLLRNYSHVY